MQVAVPIMLISAGLIVARAARRRHAATLALREHVALQYLVRPSAGKRTGRNIGEHANMATDLEAVHVPVSVAMADWRSVPDAPKLDEDGFALLPFPALGGASVRGGVPPLLLNTHFFRPS